MRLGVLTEPVGENRVAIVPNSVKKLMKKGLEVFLEKGAGEKSNYSDSDYSCLLYTSPSPRDQRGSRMPSSA